MYSTSIIQKQTSLTTPVTPDPLFHTLFSAFVKRRAQRDAVKWDGCRNTSVWCGVKQQEFSVLEKSCPAANGSGGRRWTSRILTFLDIFSDSALSQPKETCPGLQITHISQTAERELLMLQHTALLFWMLSFMWPEIPAQTQLKSTPFKVVWTSSNTHYLTTCIPDGFT